MKALKNDYETYVNEIRTAIEKCYANSIEPQNAELMRLYAFIGRSICFQGEKAFVVFLADLLEKQFPEYKGFSPRNLRRMRDYYRAYENDPSLLHETVAVGWTQNVVILESCESNEQRTFYIDLSLEQNLSKLALLKAMEAETFEREIHDAEEMENTQIVMEAKACIVSECNIVLKDPNRIAYRPFITMCSTCRQGNLMPFGGQDVQRIGEVNILGLWMSSQRACRTSLKKPIESFVRKTQWLWMDWHRRQIEERFTATIMIPGSNRVVWGAIKTCKFFSVLSVLMDHIFLIKLFCNFSTAFKSVEIIIVERCIKPNDESSTHPKLDPGVRISQPSH